MKTDIKKSLRIIAVAILIALLTMALAATSLSFILRDTIINPRFLNGTLREQEAFGQIRQLMFRMVNSSLPNGGDSIPYLEGVLSEDWLEKEINTLLRDFFAFARGERGDTPIITFHGLKKQVADSLDNNRSYQDRTKLVQYWFDPLPDEVRLEDFMSIDFLWTTRRIISLMVRFPWIMFGTTLVIISLIYLTLLDWKQLALWASAGLIASGGILIILGTMLGWLTGRMSIIMNLMDTVLYYGVPEISAENFLMALVGGITGPMNIIGILSILLGGAIIFFVPMEERILFLVK